MKIEIDISGLEKFARQLGTIDAVSLGAASVRAVNQASDEVYDMVRPRMIATINLSDDYVQQRMEVVHAKNANDATASIIGKGSGVDMTMLARYGAKQLTTPVKYPNSSFAAGARGMNPNKPGSPLSWKLRTGNPLLGIPVDMKQAGISVEVTRGSRKDIAGGFLMALKGGNGYGLFTRDGTKLKMSHRYGPSVYQLFKTVADASIDEISTTLENSLSTEIDSLITKVFE